MAQIRAGLAEIDITPPLGTELSGSLTLRVAKEVRDPIFARGVILESGDDRVAIVGLDALAIRWSDVNDIRQQIAKEADIPPGNIMIAASHTHCGPATTNAGVTRRDESYLAWMKDRVVGMLREACANLTPVQVGIGSGFEGRISFNRRYIMKDGTVRCHPPIASPQVLCAEGTIDPEVGVVCIRDLEGKTLGYTVNFACHPCHALGGEVVSSAYPGSLARHLKERQGEKIVSAFLNGASGNIHPANPVDSNYDGMSPKNMERMGQTLAEEVAKAAEEMEFATQLDLRVVSRTLELPLREVSPQEIEWAKQVKAGEAPTTVVPGAQPFAPNEVYADAILALVERRQKRAFAHAEVQVIRLGQAAYVGIPAEYFVQHGLRIKLESPIQPTWIVSCANGMVGYVPHREAFKRGGYETTTSLWSKLAPEAGDLLADAALELLREVSATGGQ